MTYDVGNPGLSLGQVKNVVGLNLLMGSQSLPVEKKGGGGVVTILLQKCFFFFNCRIGIIWGNINFIVISALLQSDYNLTSHLLLFIDMSRVGGFFRVMTATI